MKQLKVLTKAGHSLEEAGLRFLSAFERSHRITAGKVERAHGWWFR
jgi:hypothetical protein